MKILLDKTGDFVHTVPIMADNLARQCEYFSNHGFTETQAQALVLYHQDRVEQLLATKRDIADVRKEIAGVYQAVEQLRADTKRDIADVRRDIEQLRADTKKDIADVRKEIAGVYQAVEQLRADTKKDIENLKLDLVIRLGAIIVASVGVLGVIVAIFR